MANPHSLGQSAPATTKTELVRIYERIQTIYSATNRVQADLASFLDRIAGSSPTDASSKGVPAPVPNGAIQTIDEALNRLEATIKETLDTIPRLARIA